MMPRSSTPRNFQSSIVGGVYKRKGEKKCKEIFRNLVQIQIPKHLNINKILRALLSDVLIKMVALDST